MKFEGYLKSKAGILLFNIIIAWFFSSFLYFTGTGLSELTLLLICWILILIIYIFVDYIGQKRKIEKLHNIMKFLDKKYLLAEVIDKPKSYLEKEYYSIIKQTMKSMTEHVSEAECTQTEYRQFIEQWIHEVKRPITASKLICENNKNEHTRKLLTQIEEIDSYVERVLYYARLGHVEKDYIIKETVLYDIVQDVLAKNKQLLIQNSVKVDTLNLHYTVFSDKKWVGFILNQIIMNSIQYKNNNPHITIEAIEYDKTIALSIKDNGIGIKASELERIFQLGFTGSNGRNSKSSTGIGLYLCNELSRKLGIRIDVQSEIEVYTKIILYFPIQKDLAIKK